MKQLFINGSNFTPDGLSQFSKYVTFFKIHISYTSVLKCPQRKQAQRGQETWQGR